MGGGKDGGGGGSISYPTPAPSPFETQLASMASSLWSSTNPLRDAFIQDWMGFLRPPGYAPMNAGNNGGNTGAQPASTPTAAGNYYGGWYPGMTDQAPMYPQYGDNISLSRTPGLAAIPSDQLFRDPYTGEITSGSNVRQSMGANGPVFNYLYDNRDQNLIPLQMGGGNQASVETGGNGPSAAFAPVPQRRYDPYALPGYAPIYDLSRGGLESQYNVAKQNVIGNTARGGLQNDALAQLEQSRAQGVGSLPAQISSGLIQDIMNKAYGAAWNSPTQSISGLSAANQGYVSSANAMLQAQMQQQALAQQQANSKGSGLGMLGMGMGSILGSAFLGPTQPWIFK